MLKRTDQLNARGGSMMPRDDFENFVKKPISEMRKDLEGEEEAPAQPKRPPLPPRIPAEPIDQAAEPLAEETINTPPKQASDREILHKQAEEFGISLDEREVFAALVGKAVRKRVLCAGGRFEAIIKTLNAGEISQVNLRVGRDLENEPSMLRVEMQNRNTIYLLAHAVVEMGEPGDTRTLPADLDERIKLFENVSPRLLQELARRYNCLTYLIEDHLDDKEGIKNS